MTWEFDKPDRGIYLLQEAANEVGIIRQIIERRLPKDSSRPADADLWEAVSRICNAIDNIEEALNGEEESMQYSDIRIEPIRIGRVTVDRLKLYKERIFKAFARIEDNGFQVDCLMEFARDSEELVEVSFVNSVRLKNKNLTDADFKAIATHLKKNGYTHYTDPFGPEDIDF